MPPSHLHPPPEVDFLALWIEALSLLLVLNLRIRLHFLHLGDPNCPCRLNSSGSATLLHASAFRVAPVYRQPIAKGANTISCRLDLCPPPLRKTSCNWIFEIHSWQAFGQILLRAPTLCLFPHTACFADSIYIKESGSLTFFDFFFLHMHRVECGSGERCYISSYNFSSPDRPPPREGIPNISLL